MIAAGPEGHRRRGVVHKDAADVGVLGQEMLDRLVGLGIDRDV